MRTINTKSLEPQIAVVSDIHGNKDAARAIISQFRTQKLDCIVLAGDIPDCTKANLRWMIKAFLKLKVPVIIFGGSHENSTTYESVLKEFKKEHLLINAQEKRNWQVKLGNYELFMIPGSESVSSGSKTYNGGNMWLLNEHKSKTLQKELNQKIKNIGFARVAAPVFFEDVEKVIAKKNVSGNNCIIFSHNPPRCQTRRGIDLAQFGKPKGAFVIEAKHLRLKVFKELGFRTERIITAESIMPLAQTQVLKKYKYPIKILRKNVGSETIRKILKKNHINKLVCGHIHEAGRRAITTKEERVKQKTPSRELLINSGEGRKGKSTILTLHKKGKISHQFLQT